MFPSLVVACLLLTYSNVISGAYQHTSEPCPPPCRCLKFEGLWSVYCNRTGITSVPRGIPINTQLLDLNSNNIGTIPPTAFSGLVNLQQLYLGGTGLNDASIADTALDLPMLQSIGLAANYFTAVPTILPHNITFLDMDDNKIVFLGKQSFINYTSLTDINFEENRMKAIDIGTFDLLQDVTSIDLAFNLLTDESFPPKLFSKNTKLEILRLRFNQLSQVVKDLPPSMLHLDYVGNIIKTVPAYAFQSLPNVQTIEFWEGQKISADGQTVWLQIIRRVTQRLN